MATTRLRKVKNREELEEMVDDFITQGYKVVSEGKDSVQLKQTDYGTTSMHIIIFLIVGWCTFFIANLVYALIANSGAERVMVRIVGGKASADDEDEDEDEERPRGKRPGSFRD